ncbi:MAG: peptidoglycan D,D-transpeptidase FtsI family protein [Fervidobacterium sp.]
MNNSRYKIVLALFLIILPILVFKIWNNIYTNQYAISAKIPALRGSIYDTKGRLLATSEIVYAAYLDVGYLKSIAGTAFKRDPDFIKMLSNFGLVEKFGDIEKKNMVKLGSFSKRDEIQKKIPTQYLRFVSIEPEERRVSVQNFGLNFIIGRTEERVGTSGAEMYFDKILRPIRDGVTSVKYSGFIGSKIGTTRIDPENGKDVRLSIDSALQKKLYEFAKNYLGEKQASEVGILIMESETGKIRVALTTQSWPTYYMGYFEPGSTIKPILFAAALELGLVTTDTHFYCPGYIKPIDGLSLTIKDLEKHGDIDLYHGLVHSCNVVSILTTKKIVDTFGKEKLYEILSSFGFGKETGIELPGEIPGKLNPPDKWYLADWAFIGIGQSIGVTPLQLLAAFNSIVNNGVYVSPTLDDSKQVLSKRIISQATSQIVKNMLLDVVNIGTGINAKLDGVNIYGKTGTAQKNRKKDVTALFVGQVELDQKYSILVWVDSPQIEKLSSVVAAPFFKNVVQELMSYISESRSQKILNDTQNLNLRGWTIKQVYSLAQKNNLPVKIYNKGLYVDKYDFELTPEGTTLALWLSNIPPSLKVY